MLLCLQLATPRAKQDEPKFNQVKHFCETSYLNSLVHFFPVAGPVRCRLWNVEGGGMQSAESEESGVLSGGCSV